MHRGLNPCRVRIASVLYSRCRHQIRVKPSPHSYRIRGHDYLSVPVNVRPYYIRTASVSCACHILAISVCEFAQGYATDVTRIWQEQHGCRADMTRRRYGFDTDICPCQLFWLFQNNRHGQIWPWRPWRIWHGCDTNMNRSTGTWYGHLSVSRPCVNPCMCKRSITRTKWSIFMMTSSNGNIFRVTCSLCGKFTGHRWILLTKASDAELWCVFLSAPE